MFQKGMAETPPQAIQFIRTFRLAALQAGSVARRLQGEVSTQKKAGQTTPEGAALTLADLATQDVILWLLHDAFPEAALDAEEETQTVRLFPVPDPDRPLIVVDPIDGTLNYSQGSGDYAVMGGWLTGQAFQAALVHFPVWEETFWAWREGGCWHQKGSAPPVQITPRGNPRRILVQPKLPKPWRQSLRDAGFDLFASHCSAVDTTAPLHGQAAAAISVGPCSRRRPVGLFLTLVAGGTVLFGGRTWHGQDPVGWTQPGEAIIVATNETLAQTIHASLT
jgi:fructose-1,6-bisphosphatase/inositol monophosphatase family enzyme